MHVEIRRAAPDEPGVAALIDELDRYQLALYPRESNHLDPAEELSKDNVHFVCACAAGQIVGCGAVKKFGEHGGYGEIKRMFVLLSHRGQGISGALLQALEEHLHAHGIRYARLETGVHQAEALALYHNRGYINRGPFGDYWHDPVSVFMEKDLSR